MMTRRAEGNICLENHKYEEALTGFEWQQSEKGGRRVKRQSYGRHRGAQQVRPLSLAAWSITSSLRTRQTIE